MKISQFFREQESIDPSERSQFGEDDALKEILRQLDINSGLISNYRWVCEFGAGNGKRISNTFQLVKNGFSAVYIEGNKERFFDLNKLAIEYPNIHPINKFISSE